MLEAAAGRAVLRVIDEEGLQENALMVGAKLKAALERLHQRHEIIGEVRGRGLMLAMDLVKDRKSKTPATEIAADIFERTREEGLVMSKSGANRNMLRMVPPMCLAESDVDVVADALERCFEKY
jgi:alanine-glyoxylate transaminase/(R)-3-amino-2-methylpropionate-pyruvate transaminase